MGKHVKLEETRVTVTFSHHKPTGLWCAESDDLHGLMIFGRSLEELEGRLAASIKGLLEADGRDVLAVIPDHAETENAWEAPSPRQVEIRFAA